MANTWGEREIWEPRTLCQRGRTTIILCLHILRGKSTPLPRNSGSHNRTVSRQTHAVCKSSCLLYTFFAGLLSLQASLCEGESKEKFLAAKLDLAAKSVAERDAEERLMTAREALNEEHRELLKAARTDPVKV